MKLEKQNPTEKMDYLRLANKYAEKVTFISFNILVLSIHPRN
jgi:hypothetical protein